MSETTDPTKSVAQALRNTLNLHGYGFQHRALMACDAAAISGGADLGLAGRWRVIADEFPVSMGGRDLHIDGVLEFTMNERTNYRLFVVVECKRVDPARSRWCFARTDHRSAPVVIDAYRRVHLEPRLPLEQTEGSVNQIVTSDPVMQLGLALKDPNATGNGLGPSLDDGVTQVLRGTGGLVEALGEWVGLNRWVVIVPLIITTAKLYTSATPLSDADLATGDLKEVEVTSRTWLWLSTNVSRSLAPSVDRTPSAKRSRSIPNRVAHNHTRSIAVANTEGLTDALTAIARGVYDLVELP